MKPYREKLLSLPNASWNMLNRRLDDAIPFQWHHHPEFELTLTLNSSGQRFIGDHVGEYSDADLVLIGPNLPHTWASREKINPDQPHVALVLWFHPDWVEKTIGAVIEFSGIQALLTRASRGLYFSPKVAALVRNDYQDLFQQPPIERLMTLFRVLNYLALDTTSQALASVAVTQNEPTKHRERIDRVLNHIHTHYTRVISINELAAIAALSVSGVHRLFGKHTQTTISDYLMQLRIGDACARLSGSNQPIAHIAESVGYSTLANFNRQFKTLMLMTPSKYRSHFRRTTE